MSISNKSVKRINKAVSSSDTDFETKTLIFHEDPKPDASQKQPVAASPITEDLPYYLL